MAQMVSTDDLKSLASEREWPCVSIYMPTYHRGGETQQDWIRFKNLLREAQRLMRAGGLRARQASELLEPAQSLVIEVPFWQHQSDGFAAFLSRGLFHYYQMPLRMKELVVVTHRFHLKPLIPWLTSANRFFVAALSLEQVKLYECTHYSAREITLPEAPQGLEDALKYDTPEKHLDFHTGAPSAAPRRPAVYHSHGGVDEAKDNVLQYLHHVDRALQGPLREERAPLVLASVEYLHGIFKQANSYRNIAQDCVRGSPEKLGADELRARAWEIVRPKFEQARRDGADKYGELAGTQLASADPKEIVPAARRGRVDTLFVALGEQLWGAFDPDREQGRGSCGARVRG